MSGDVSASPDMDKDNKNNRLDSGGTSLILAQCDELGFTLPAGACARERPKGAYESLEAPIVRYVPAMFAAGVPARWFNPRARDGTPSWTALAPLW